jgi:hypothetical protein
MGPFHATLAAHRRRLRAARATDAAVRWAFYAVLAACVVLAVSKVAGLALPAPLAAVLAAVPLAMAARAWARSFSLHDCAVHLDRTLGLEERLATALEATGPMAAAQESDAAASLARAEIPPWELPREARLLAAAALVFAAIVVIPVLEVSGAGSDPALVEQAKLTADELEKIASKDPVLARAAKRLREGKIEEAAALLLERREELEKKWVESGGKDAEARELARAAEAAAKGIGAQLAATGRSVPAPLPVAAEGKLECQAVPAPAPAEEFDPAPVAQAIAARLRRQDWDRKYDDVVYRYFGSKP